MSANHEQYIFRETPSREADDISDKVDQSISLLTPHITDSAVAAELSFESMLFGEFPRLSPYDLEYLPDGVDVVSIPRNVRESLLTERSYDLIRWNTPEQVLERLKISMESFKHPVIGSSRVMDRVMAEGKVVSFDNLRVESPVPANGRHSRTKIITQIESSIMGSARILSL